MAVAKASTATAKALVATAVSWVAKMSDMTGVRRKPAIGMLALAVKQLAGSYLAPWRLPGPDRRGRRPAVTG